MDKRGQFFIVAAMIIVSVIAGVTSIVNYVDVSPGDDRIYNLAEEIGYETNRVLDWGVFNSVDIDELTKSFLEEYADYIGEQDVLFIFGNEDDLQALRFTFEGVGSVALNTGGSKNIIEINRRTGREAEVVVREGGGRRGQDEKVQVDIDGIKYDFVLKDGQNFYFVIIKEGDERYVASR